MRAAAKRDYNQEARAQQTEATAREILSAAIQLVRSVRRVSTITLEDIARESGLTVRTVLRRFGSRDGVLEAAFVQLRQEVEAARPATPTGDVGAALNALLEHYEEIGDLNIRALEEEDQLPSLHALLEVARDSHRDWLRHVFGPRLATLSSAEREQRITSLYAATDVYLWKLLRRDLQLGREETAATFRRLVHGVLEARGEEA